MSQPVWAPDSFRLAVVAGGSLVVLDRGSGPQLIAASDVMQASSVGDPSFSPDSQKLVYLRSDRAGGDLVVADLQSGDTTPLTDDDASGSPVWGAGVIAYDRDKDVWLIDGDGSHARRLTHTGAGIVPVAWSADGSRLLAANPPLNNGRLWVVDAATGRAHALTGWTGDLYGQTLSRDGSTVLAGVGCGGRPTPFGLIETIPFAGGAPRVLVRGPCRATWSR
jgi:Tol biopolymer transport system component